MVARNEITGDAIQTRKASEKYSNNYDLIFGKDKKMKSVMQQQYEVVTTRVVELMGEAGMIVTFKPFSEIVNPEVMIERLYKLGDRLTKTLAEHTGD